eukprot:scaffold19195_cov59-Phaeocystis_antarctica.AAC.4
MAVTNLVTQIVTGRATVVGITRAPTISEDGGVHKACDTKGDGRVGAVVVDVGPDQRQALQHAERKARTYGKALIGLASLLCLSVCGNLASSALSILVFKESRFSDAIPLSSSVVLSDSKAAAPVGTGLASYAGTGLKGVIVTSPFEAPTYVKDTPADPEPPVVAKAPADDTVPLVVSLSSVPGMKRCAIAPSGTEACWELADPAITDIPDDFLESQTDLTGTLKVGPAVKTIGALAFADTKFTALDLSEATSLVEIGTGAFSGTDLAGTLVIPATVTTIGYEAFGASKLTGLDLSKATSLVSIADSAFLGTDLGGTLVIPAKVTTIGPYAFANTKLTGLDLSKATSLEEIGTSVFANTKLTGRLDLSKVFFTNQRAL